MRRSPQRLKSQRGVGLMLGIFLMFTFLLMMAWIIDIAQVELFISSVQSAADAAALAGADQFDMRTPDQMLLEPDPVNSRKESWRNAKEAVFDSLRRSLPKYRFDTDFEPTVQNCSKPAAPGSEANGIDMTPKWLCYEYDFGKLVVSVERGIWYEKNINPPREQGFIPLDRLFETMPPNPPGDVCTALQTATGAPANHFFPQRCKDPGPLSPLHDPYWVPNAVRVKVTLKKLPTILGRMTVIGLKEFTNIGTRETVASRQTLIEHDPLLVTQDEW